jgi:hypothetical protein
LSAAPIRGDGHWERITATKPFARKSKVIRQVLPYHVAVLGSQILVHLAGHHLSEGRRLVLSQQTEEVGCGDHIELAKGAASARGFEVAADLQGEAVCSVLFVRGIGAEAMGPGTGIAVAPGPVGHQVTFAQACLGIEEITYLSKRAGCLFCSEESSTTGIGN